MPGFDRAPHICRYIYVDKLDVCFERERGGSVTSLTANLCHLISVMLSPYMPDVAETIQEQLNWTNDQRVLTNQFVCSLPEGHSIGAVGFLSNVHCIIYLLL